MPRGMGLSARLGLALVAFVVAGSLLLIGWLGHLERAQSRRVFEALANADADFIRELNLPRSDKLALDLSRLLKMLVFFRHNSGRMIPAADERLLDELRRLPASSAVSQLAERRSAMVINLDGENDVIFVRDEPAVAVSLTQPSTLVALAAFWLLSLALAFAVTRGVVRPLASLTKKLPHVFGDAAPSLPEARRSDEIGKLAGALLDARARLGEERARREQAERLALLGRVATGLAHEIKNPVASIQLHAQLIEGAALDAEAASSLQMIGSESRVIEGLVNQWLYVARPEQPRMSRLDLREILLRMIETMQAQAAHSSVVIEARLPDPVHVAGDQQRLAQAFRNLALNAIQAMPRGGTLVIEGTSVDDVARVTFADSGTGFSADALAHGSELFFSEREGGMGIGLNVVKEVIAHHGGTLSLENPPLGGARVTVTLPLVD